MLRARHALVAAAIAGAAIAGTGFPPAARAGLTLEEICAAKGPVRVTSTDTNIFIGDEVLMHMPGPTPKDFGDFRIGTADDGIHPGLMDPPDPEFSPLFGCPNDLFGESSASGISCGVAGAPGTRLLHGTVARESQESSLHSPDEDQLSLAKQGYGSYSFIVSTTGDLQSLSYIVGSVTAVLTNISGNVADVEVVNVTLAGTTLSPNILFTGPVNTDLITVGPGDDLKYHEVQDDETSETIMQGCNGFAPGVDGVSRWSPRSEGPFPKFPDVNFANRGEWNLTSNPDDGQGRVITAVSDTVSKVPTADGFFVTENTALNGYLFPIDEAEALLTPAFRRDNEGDLGDLPDVPGFPGSGLGLARYFVEVLTPLARQEPDNRLVGYLRGSALVTIIGIDTLLDITVVGAGDFGEFDICKLDVKPCTF